MTTIEVWSWIGMGLSGALLVYAVSILARVLWAKWRERRKKRHGAGLVWDQALHARIDGLTKRLDQVVCDGRSAWKSHAATQAGLLQRVEVRLGALESDVRLGDHATHIGNNTCRIEAVERDLAKAWLNGQKAHLESRVEEIEQQFAGANKAVREVNLRGRVEDLEKAGVVCVCDWSRTMNLILDLEQNVKSLLARRPATKKRKVARSVPANVSKPRMRE